MKNNIAGYAFDIEGTLYNNGNLQKGVIKLFTEILKTKLPIAFISGMNQKEMRDIINLISLSTHQILTPFIASNTGSYITYKNKLFNKEQHSITIEELEKIKNVVKKYKNIIILYKLNNANYILSLDNPNPTQLKYLNRNFEIRKNLTPNMLKKIYSIELNCHDKNTMNIIKNELKEKFNGHAQLIGDFLQISHFDKWQALNSIYKNKVNNICYFGDGINDIKCLTECNYTILGNTKIKKLYKIIETSATPKIATCDYSNPEIIKYITNKDYNKDYLAQITQECKNHLN